MKQVVIAAVLTFCGVASFAKDESPACAALQDAKEVSASGKKFEPYRLVTNDGEQMITSAEQAIQLWTPLCHRPQPSGATKLGVSNKTAGAKSGQG